VILALGRDRREGRPRGQSRYLPSTTTRCLPTPCGARLAAERDLVPVSVAYSVAEANSRLSRAPVDAAVLGYMLGDGTGTELAAHLQETLPRIA